MAPANLNNLPADITFLITQYLDPDSLRNLARVDKQSHASASSTLFHSITIATSSLQSDIDQWRSILQRNSAMHMVRRLRVDSCLGPDFEYLYSDQADPLDSSSLTGFVSQLSQLSRLVWASSNQFPDYLLDIIQKLPSCQLYLDTFRLDSICDASLEQYERSLISSPCLSSISCCLDVDSPRLRDIYKTLLQVICLAPNLRIVNTSEGSSCMESSDPPLNQSTWLEIPDGQGRLEELHINTLLNIDHLPLWLRKTDCSKLRILELDGIWGEGSDARIFEYMRNDCNFQNLDQLSLDIPRAAGYDENVALAARGFICNLQPLASLSIGGLVDRPLLEPILEVHGTRLRKLAIYPTVEADEDMERVYLNQVTGSAANVSAVLSHCPLLEEFVTDVPRTCGNTDEVAIYRAIGILPRLQIVRLTLDANDLSFLGEDAEGYMDEDEVPTNPSFDNFDNEFLDNFDRSLDLGPGPRKGHVRIALINSAIDKKLACSIFNVIAAAKPPKALPLEQLHISVSPGGKFGSGVSLCSFADMCDILGQSWQVARNIRDDRRNEIDATRVVEGLHRSYPMDDAIIRGWSTVGPVFRRLWPSPRDGYDGPEGWEQDWKSLPLEIGDDVDGEVM